MALKNALVVTGVAIFMATLLFTANNSQAQSWELENRVACLFEAAPIQTPLEELQAFTEIPSSMRWVSDKVASGMAAATFAEGSVIVRPEATVLLNSIVTREIDEQSEEDSYWQYYLDCDKWQVSFNDEEPVYEVFAPANMNTETGTIASTLGFAWLKERHDEWLAQINDAMFHVVENVATLTPTTPIAEPPALEQPQIPTKVLTQQSDLIGSMLQATKLYQSPIIDFVRETVCDMHEKIYSQTKQASGIFSELTWPIVNGF